MELCTERLPAAEAKAAADEGRIHTN